MNTGQTVYEQLQEILIECLELGWKPRGNSERLFKAIGCVDEKYMIHNGDGYSYHELFSKDSGIMEFVDLKGRKYTHVNFHYMQMGFLTAEQKIQYFLDNAIIPTK